MILLLPFHLSVAAWAADPAVPTVVGIEGVLLDWSRPFDEEDDFLLPFHSYGEIGVLGVPAPDEHLPLIRVGWTVGGKTELGPLFSILNTGLDDGWVEISFEDRKYGLFLDRSLGDGGPGAGPWVGLNLVRSHTTVEAGGDDGAVLGWDGALRGGWRWQKGPGSFGLRASLGYGLYRLEEDEDDNPLGLLRMGLGIDFGLRIHDLLDGGPTPAAPAPTTPMPSPSAPGG